MKIIVNEENYEDNLRLDKFLSEEITNHSRSKLSRLIKNGNVLVNKKKVKASYIIDLNDQIEIEIDKLKLKPIKAENLELEVIYRDNHIAIINKPVGMIVHPTNQVREKTLVNGLLYEFENLSSLAGEERRGIVHRLDMDTSGLIIVALTNKAHEHLSGQFKYRTVTKKYRTIVNGNFNEDRLVIEKPISRSKYNRKMMDINPDGKYSKTTIDIISQVEGYSLLDIDLFTGRTHQIRVHLKSINRPILGDPLYNTIKNNFNLNHQLLESYRLEINHPISGERLIFEIDPSSEFKRFQKILNLRS